MSGWLALQLLLVSTSPAVDAADSVNSLPIDSSQRHPHRAPQPQRSAEPRTSGSSTYAQRLQTHKKAERLLAEVPAGVREERAEARELLRVQRWALRRTHLPRPRKQNLDPTAESHAITNDHHHMNQNLADPPHHSSGRSHKNHRERDGSDLDTGGGTRGGGGGTGAGGRGGGMGQGGSKKATVQFVFVALGSISQIDASAFLIRNMEVCSLPPQAPLTLTLTPP